ncbi:hypothetical protein [Xanthomonas citri]|uniref:hypothetical protein n=1 Tax=Xanthomonas citri TaxID=346 RepID=UPI002AB112A9|nr:hypothetical protein [Xanthomonas citri]
MRRADFFCEDSQEFGDVLADMAQEAEALAFMTPANGLFIGYRDRLFAIAREVSTINGGLRAAIAIIKHDD